MPGHMKRSHKRKSRRSRRTRKRRGGMLTPSMLKECKKAGKKWHECAAHLKKAAKASVEATKKSPNMAATVAQAKAMKNIAPVLKKKQRLLKLQLN